MEPSAEDNSSPRSSESLEIALTEDDFQQFQSVIAQLRMLPSANRNSLALRLVSFFRDAQVNLRRRALRLAGELAPDEPALWQAVLQSVRSDPVWTVREVAVETLNQWSTPTEETAIVLLDHLLKEKQPLVRNVCTQVLIRWEPHRLAVLQSLSQLLESASIAPYCRGLVLLSQLPAGETLLQVELARAIKHSHRKIRRLACELCGPLGENALPFVPELIRRKFERDPAVSFAAEQSLQAIRPQLPAPYDSWLKTLLKLESVLSDVLKDFLASVDADVRAEFEQLQARRAKWKAELVTSSHKSSVNLSGDSIEEKGEHAWMLARLWELLIARDSEAAKAP